MEEEAKSLAANKTVKKDKETPARAKPPLTIGAIAPVLVPVPTDGPYSYAVGEGQEVIPGTIVRVPLGSRMVTGIVWDGEADTRLDRKKVRPIDQIYDLPPIGPDIRHFIDWVSRYTMASPGLVARMVISAPNPWKPEKPVQGVRRTGNKPERLTPERASVLQHTDDGNVWAKSALMTKAGVTAGVIDGLVKAGSLEYAPLPPKPLADTLEADHNPPTLFEGQIKAAAMLRHAVRENAYSVHLIDGITGSGKTEVYFEAIAEALEADKQILILVPEISLTAAFLDRFARRFGGYPAEWHSDIAPGRRERIWRGVAQGEVKVVIGARSALFLPYQNLGLIVVDEEHDMAYKQEDRIIYHARDMAVVRGHLGNFPVLLASATPSLETFVNAREGRYHRVSLPGRIADAELPDLKAIDMRENGPEGGRWLAPDLVNALRETLARGQQSLLFLNRRGYAPLTLCRQCGFRFQCPDCAAWLVEHRFKNTIECHHCGHSQKKPRDCPNCDGENTLVACGPGVERIHEEILELLPQARSIVLSSDMFSTSKTLQQELHAIERGEADIIIGTQLIAKGHNFPKLALVGVVDADLGLAHGDMRAAERTFQLLSQVTGRAGRAGGKSLALLQTYAPDHGVIKALLAGDRDTFYQAEAEQRKQAHLPPYTRLVSFIISSKDKISAMQYGQHLRLKAPSDLRILILGPSEAPISIVRGRYRARLLVQAPKSLDIQAYIQNWLATSDPPRGSVNLQIDVDPQSFW